MQILYQAERSECGLVSLAMVASHHGLNYELASLRGRFPVSLKGLTLKAVIKIAGDLNMDSRAVRCEVEDLAQIRLPAILHWRMDHFVVLVKKRGKRYIINDPGIGQIIVSEREMNESFTGVALELWPGKEFKKADLGNSLKLSAVIPRTKGLLSALVMIVLTALAIEAMVLVMPILQQLIIDDALVTSDGDLLMLLTIATGIFLIGQSATAAVRGIIQRNLTSTLSLVIPSSVFKHMASLPTSWFERRAAADVVNRMDSANSIHRTLTSSTINAGIDGLVALIALAAMFAYSPFLTLIVVAAFIFYICVRLLSYGVLNQKSAGALVQQARVQGLLWETLRGISTVKLFNGEGPRKNQFLATLSQSVRLGCVCRHHDQHAKCVARQAGDRVDN